MASKQAAAPVAAAAAPAAPPIPAPASPRKTCKVVLRTYQGTRGARIHPKGCKVRSYADDAGRDKIRKFNKREDPKYKIKTPVGALDRYVWVRRTVNGVVHRKKILWDTGAESGSCGLIVA